MLVEYEIVMSKHSDVLIIGGGIIGLSCAYYLIKAGRQVRIIEQDKIGSGASHGNCGLIVFSGLDPLCAPGTIQHEIKRLFRPSSPLYIRPGFTKGRLQWLLGFARKCNAAHFSHAMHARNHLLQYSQMLYDSLFSEENLDGEVEKKGGLLVYKSKAEWQEFAKINEHLKPFGLDAEPYLGEALFELEPALSRDVYGAWYHEVDGHLRPDKLIEEWKQLLLGKGATIIENCRLESFGFDRGRVVNAVTTAQEYSAETYVLATGAWTPHIAEQLDLNIPIQPGKGYSITMERPGICPAIPCHLQERGVVATPWESGFRLGGTMEFSGFNTVIYKQRIQNLKTAAREYLQEPLPPSDHEEWVGIRPMTNDDLPIIDRAPGQQNIVLATGHGMMGISMAPGTGKLVTEMITGSDPHIDISPFSVKRFQ
jgi:D-amino-acid dehydrogenase